MISAPRHPREAQRLRSMPGLLGHLEHGDSVVATLVALAARLLDSPQARLTLLDRHDAWTVAADGRAAGGAERHGRDRTISAWVVANDAWLSVPDLQDDPRFHDGEDVAAGVRSYHGVPLTGPDGLPVGALGVLDIRPRHLSREQRQVLEDLGTVASHHLGRLAERRRPRSAGPGAPSPASDPREPRQPRQPGPSRPGPRAAPDDPPGARVEGLAAGLAAGQVVPFFQPILAVPTQRVVAVEAVARWESPTLGLLAPTAFLEPTEVDDVAATLDATVLEEACHQVQQWRTRRPLVADLVLTVDVTAGTVAGGDLVDLVTAALSRSGLPVHGLTIGLAADELDRVVRDGGLDALRTLRAHGVGVAVDDVGRPGSGLPDLRELEDLPVTELRVGAEVVAGLGHQPAEELLMASVVGVARRLDLAVVATGVETPRQVEALSRLGCDRAQGNLFQHPTSPADLEVSGLLGPVEDSGPGLPTVP